MAQVGYIAPGKSIRAINWHGLFQRLEDLLEAAFDGKSPLVAQLFGSNPDLFGDLFYFVDGGDRLWTVGQTAYDHAAFEAAAAAATEVDTDDDSNIMTVSGLGTVLEGSLEAHRRDGYYLFAQGTRSLEKRYAYAVAELVFEGEDQGSMVIPDHYDKFNFFRLHNLNPYAISVSFGGHFSVAIPPLQCRAVRRTSVTSGYNATWKYFWRHRKGDPRFLDSLTYSADPNWSIEGGKIYRTMRANNVASPRVLYEWIDFLTSPNFEGTTRAYRDPHVCYDAAELYCPDYFPDPEDTEQLFGNFLHHKGKVVHGGTEYTFQGYETIAADMPWATFDDQPESLSITATSGGTPATALSTNLFSRHNPNVSSYTAGASFVFEKTNTALPGHLPYRIVSTPVSVSSSDLELELDRISTQGMPPSAKPIAPHRETLADILTLNAFGTDELLPTDQDSDCQTLTNRRLKITPWGPRILYHDAIALTGSVWYHATSAAAEVFGSPLSVLSGGVISTPRAIQFHGYGWGRLSPVRPAFISPRDARRFANLYLELSQFRHPWIELLGNGEDFQLHSAHTGYETTPQAFLASIDRLGGWQPFDVWAPPDNMHGRSGSTVTRMLALPLLVDHFNAMAAYANSVKKIEPLNFRALRIKIEGVVEAMPGPNLAGVGGTEYCPKTMYCSFANNSTAHKFFQALGVPIKTVSDLPSDYAAAIGATYHWKYLFQEQVTSVTATELNGSFWKTTFESVPGSQASGRDADESNTLIYRLNWATPLNTTGVTFLWVTIADVKSTVEALGWRFKYEQSSIPCAIKEISPSNEPAALYVASHVWEENLPSEPAIGVWDDTDKGVGGWRSRVFAWVDDSAGDWKAVFGADLGFTISDVQAGDTVISNVSTNPITAPWFYSAETSLDYKLIIAGASIHDSVARRRHFLHQVYFSSGYTNESQIAQIPVQYPKHAQDNFSAISFENAVAARSNKNNIALEAGAKSGSASSQSAGAGDTTLSFAEGESREVVVLRKCLVNV